MIPWYYATIGGFVLAALGWAASTFNFLHSRSLYDAEAEKAEQFAANIAQKWQRMWETWQIEAQDDLRLRGHVPQARLPEAPQSATVKVKSGG